MHLRKKREAKNKKQGEYQNIFSHNKTLMPVLGEEDGGKKLRKEWQSGVVKLIAGKEVWKEDCIVCKR